jgi:hypothetical protein
MREYLGLFHTSGRKMTLAIASPKKVNLISRPLIVNGGKWYGFAKYDIDRKFKEVEVRHESAKESAEWTE